MPRRFVDDGDQAPTVTRSTSLGGGLPNNHHHHHHRSSFRSTQHHSPSILRSARSTPSPSGMVMMPSLRATSSGGGSVAFMASQTTTSSSTRTSPATTQQQGHRSNGGGRSPSRTPSPSVVNSGGGGYRHKSPRSSTSDRSSQRQTYGASPPTLSRSSSVPSRTDDDEDFKPEFLGNKKMDDNTWDESSSLSDKSLGLSGRRRRRSSRTSPSSTPHSNGTTTTGNRSSASAGIVIDSSSMSVNSEEAVTKEKAFLIPENSNPLLGQKSSSSLLHEGDDDDDDELLPSSKSAAAAAALPPMTELQTRAVSYVLDEDIDEEDQYNLEDAAKDIWGDPNEEEDDRKISAKEQRAAAARQQQQQQQRQQQHQRRIYKANSSSSYEKQQKQVSSAMAAGVAMANSDGKKPSTPSISNLAATQAKAAERAMMSPDERLAVDAKDKEKQEKARIREERAVAMACNASVSTADAAAKPPPLEEQQIFSAPGAHRVGGINGGGGGGASIMSDLDYTVDGDTNSAQQASKAESAMPSVFSAHVVDDVEAHIVSDEEDVEDFEPYLGEQLPPPPEPDPIVVARPFDEAILDPDSVKGLIRNPRVQVLLAFTFLVFLGLIAGIIFGIVGIAKDDGNKDVDPMFEALQEALSPESLALVVNDPSSPQARAWEWWRNDALSQTNTNLQRYALATLYYATAGEMWSSNDLWLSEQTECAWFTKATDQSPCVDGEHINRLDLVNNMLDGTIPEEIGLLTDMEVMDLSMNRLEGAIPPSVSSLSRLEVLRIEKSFLVGSLPTELGLLTRLRRLELGSNKLTGSIPDEWAPLAPELRTLLLQENELSGTVPDFDWTSTTGNVLQIQVQCNKFTGAIPSSVCTDFDPTLPVVAADCDLTEACVCCFPCDHFGQCGR